MPHREKGWWAWAAVQGVVSVIGGIAVLWTCGGWIANHAMADTFAKRAELQAVEARVHSLEADQVEQNKVITNLVHGVEMRLMSLDMQVSNVIQLLNDRRVKLSGGREF